MADGDVSKALEEARKLVASLEAYEAGPATHLGLLKQVDAVRRALETPFDINTRLIEAMSLSGALHTLLEIGALQKLPQDGSSISAADLAKACNVDASALARCYRVILSHGFATETDPDVYSHNVLTRSFQPEALGAFFHICMSFNKSWVHLPDYFKSHEPSDIFDLKKSPFVFAEGKDGMTYYEVLNLDPAERDLWNSTMQQIEKNMPILGMFPFATLKEQVEKEPERPFIVDVGGGRGQASLAIMQDIGGSFGAKVILQDLPVVIDTVKPEDVPGIEAMAYDALTPQPIKNAHVYFFRRLLHDFYSPVCIEFLKNTVPAMGPDSRLIICDMLVPDRVEPGENMELYWLDFCLMMMTGKEKTLAEFNEIFDAVGLELVKIYPSGVGRTVMLETKLKQA